MEIETVVVCLRNIIDSKTLNRGVYWKQNRCMIKSKMLNWFVKDDKRSVDVHIIIIIDFKTRVFTGICIMLDGFTEIAITLSVLSTLKIIAGQTRCGLQTKTTAQERQVKVV